MEREEALTKKPGDKVRPKIGPWEGHVCEILQIEMDSGAYRGWFTVKLPSGDKGLFAGEEVVSA